jgi:hypothetical protein
VEPPAVSVVLPCLNEQGSVGVCVARAKAALEAAGIAAEVVVCDNGSTDASAEEAVAAGARVVSEPRRGYGSAYLAGIEAATGGIIVLADADATYPLEEAPTFVEAARSRDTLVMGSRFKGTILPDAMPFLHRTVGSPVTRLLLRVLFGVRCTDPHSGMRAMRRSVFDTVRPSSLGMEFAIEMVMNASRRGVPLHEIPITYHPRVGDSKLRALPDGWALVRFLLLYSPMFLYVVPGVVATALGVATLAWLLTADRAFGTVTFSLNTLVVGALLTVVGYQVVTFGICARTYLLAAATATPRDRALGGWFSLERGLVGGAIAVLTGIALVATVGTRWLVADLGALDRADQGLVLVGLTVAVVGVQTIFSSFLLSLMTRDVSGERR